MKIVLDTNIYIASLLYEGLCFDLIAFVFNPKNGHEVFISDDILKELHKKIESKKEQMSTNALNWLVIQLNHFTRKVVPNEKIHAIKRDASDNKILECASAAKVNLIITMDKDILKLKTFRNIGIVHPKTLSYIFGANF